MMVEIPVNRMDNRIYMTDRGIKSFHTDKDVFRSFLKGYVFLYSCKKSI